MGTSVLELYNHALRMCAEKRLANLSETGERKALLDDVWGGGNGAVNTFLEMGLWIVAKRSARFDFDPDFVPQFGYQYRYEKPGDWIRTAMVCQDEFMNTPLTLVSDESGSWFADITPIYVMYISSDPDYGGNLGAWPGSMEHAMAGYLAEEIIDKLTTDQKRRDDVRKESKRLLTRAKSMSAMNESAGFLPMGAWVRGRIGRRSALDRGNQNRLIG
jgi:hypothetical protein